MQEAILLLTATIVPQSYELLKLIDPEVRCKQYIENLIRFITRTRFTHFVFCENSSYELPEKKQLEELCLFYGKRIEFLSFEGNTALIQKFHRSYGDQEIMEYALDHSQILSLATSFYKITGRYWIQNVDDLLDRWNGLENVFIKGGIGMETVHTAFFKTTPEYFRQHFYGKGNQLTQPFARKSLERLYYYYIRNSGINMTIRGAHPEFSAEWGAGGRMDEHGWKKWKTKIFAKLGIYDIKTTKFQKGDPILKK